MEFERTNKKLKYIIVSEIVIDPGDNEQEVQEVLEKARELGEAEIVDIQVIEED